MPTGKTSAQACVDLAKKLSTGEVLPLTKGQLYVRETVQKLRTIEPKFNRLNKAAKDLKKPLVSRIFNLK
ncbi:hypothetical protein D9M71_615100 [compost metagenome]